ncbi:hypothetical protein [Celeribacter neptunius]|uniref:Uncharacterized protein n=1 Tax=Celeribacter neptunius TaxID=588602 RepID=A0A1I3IRA3_9RHOB|nr:hypothetical protein [Celeribacter neptunius]SFI50293.1 hypothetical protein SAMN04487991_0104 [Celeribacter neptunius]
MHLYFVGFTYGAFAMAPLLFVVFAARTLKADSDARQLAYREVLDENRDAVPVMAQASWYFPS